MGRSDQQDYTSAAWVENFHKRHLLGESRSDSRGDATETSIALSGPSEDSSPSSYGPDSPTTSVTGHDPRSRRESSRCDDRSGFEPHEREHASTLSQEFASDTRSGSEVQLSPMSSELKGECVSSTDHTDGDLVDVNVVRRRGTTSPSPSPPAAQASRCISAEYPASLLPVRSTVSNEERRHTAVSPEPAVKRHKSIPDIQGSSAMLHPPPQPSWVLSSTETSPISVPSPSCQQGELLRALHNIKVLLEQQPNIAGPDDYVMIGKLMEKVKVLGRPSSTPGLAGGMCPPETVDCLRSSKKRGVVEMSV